MFRKNQEKMKNRIKKIFQFKKFDPLKIENFALLFFQVVGLVCQWGAAAIALVFLIRGEWFYFGILIYGAWAFFDFRENIKKHFTEIKFEIPSNWTRRQRRLFFRKYVNPKY